MSKKTNLFTIFTKILIIILPFYVFLKVLFEFKFQIPLFGIFIKELIIIFLLFSLFYTKIKDKIKFEYDILDYLIFSYIIYGIGISLFNGLGINSIIFGGRYDFIFLLVFLIYKHSNGILKLNLNSVLSIFLKSALVSLIIGVGIKFILHEEFLLNFGYINYASNWQFNGGIPIYHGLDASGLKRFQGIMESPNSMAFFITITIGTLLHKYKNKLQYHIILLSFMLFGLIIITYSRSALLGFGIASISLFLLDIKNIYRKYKKQTMISIIILSLVSLGLLFLFQEKLHNIFLRDGSTKGHFERMEIGYNRFQENLLGQGLGTSGPAYRKIYTSEEISKNVEAYYIPESWFIQQLIEGGIIYFLLFTTIVTMILIKSYSKSFPLFGAFLAIIVMNIFLHSFESTYNSVLLFLFLGILLNNKNKLVK